MKAEYTTIEAYIAFQPPEIRSRLEALRGAIREAVPGAAEKISWGMPTFYLSGNVIHFAAAKHHIGLYPGESGVRHFLPRLSGYKTSKGAIQLPNKDPLPLDLVREIAAFRAAENRAFAEEKARANPKRPEPNGGTPCT